MPGATDGRPRRPTRPTDRAVAPGSPAGRHRRPPGAKPRRRLAFLAALALIVAGFGTLLAPLASRRLEPAPDRAPAAAAGSTRAPVAVDAAAAPLVASPTATPTPIRRPPAGKPSARPAPTGTAGSRSPDATRTTRPSRGAARVPDSEAGSAPAVAAADPADQVITLVNRERAAAGCPAVTAQPQLTEAARRHSADQAEHDTMSHTGSDGSSPWERAERAGYPAAIGENVAAGYRTAEAVMTGWMESEGHRANILNCRARAIGVGLATADDGTTYWTQLFGSAA